MRSSLIQIGLWNVVEPLPGERVPSEKLITKVEWDAFTKDEKMLFKDDYRLQQKML